MKEFKLIVKNFLILSVALFSSCNNDDEAKPVAAFSSSATEATTGEEISFTNESQNAYYYQWEFGDGDVSISESPKHEYDYAGEYEVSLVAIGDGGSDSTSMAITVTANYDVSIYEGKGISAVDVYDIWSEIQNVYNTTDTVCYIYDYTAEYGYYYNIIYYYNEGVAFLFLTEDGVVTNTDKTYLIYVFSPYEGYTSKGIGIDSNIDKVIEAYGTPGTEYEGDGYTGYWYDSIGVDFYTYGTDRVDEIDIYEASETSSSSATSIESASVKQSMVRKMLKDRDQFPFYKNK